MNLADLTVRAREVANEYDRLNARETRQSWTVENYMAGFVGDVGDLSKLIMGKMGVRHVSDVDTRLEHELADCLWSILVISDTLNIDLELAFKRTMGTLMERMTIEKGSADVKPS